ncbi:hypothetical protein Prudu_336S000200 [Prunus dulcis]|uniref:Uncharacterized protein n=1 Tax=Prunus dulcis TaxID=3755 RepID=A0A5H2Y0A6_PRUDU|nr:hypothetical protein Prudu_336S000200 [Prunus dulcis]
MDGARYPGCTHQMLQMSDTSPPSHEKSTTRKQVKSFNESVEALTRIGAAYLCDRSLPWKSNPHLCPQIRIWESHLCRRRDATVIGHRRFRNHHPRKNLYQEAWKQLGFGVDTCGRSPHALHLFAEMSHSCWVCNGGAALLDFDLGYHMGIRDDGGGEFLTSCFIGGLMTESFARTVLARFVPVQEASTPNLKLLKRVQLESGNSMFSNSSFRPQVTSGMQKMAAVGECSAEGNWKGYAHLDFSCILGEILTFF